MQPGVILLDALGFKGIWSREDGTESPERAEAAISKLEKLRAAGENIDNRFNESAGVREFGTAYISDSVVIAAWAPKDVPDPKPPLKHPLLTMFTNALTLALKANDLALTTSPAWNYRGCISIGSLLMHDDRRFYVGPAVDDAARYERVAEGAFVWMTPAAFKRYQEMTGKPGRSAGTLVLYRVPVKACGEIESLVLNPVAGIRREEWKTRRDLILSLFKGHDASIAKKRRHTEDVLDHALQCIEESYKQAGSWPKPRQLCDADDMP